MTGSIRLGILGFSVGLTVLVTGCTGLAKVDLGRVVTSGRDGWQHPEQVIQALAIQPGDRVAEIGAGSGYWLPFLASAVGSEGRVYAVDVEEEKVDELRALIQEAGWQNVVAIRGEFQDPLLPDGSIDLVLTCLTYHHIEDREPYFSRLQSDLAPDGRVAHLDDRPDAPAPLSWFQNEGHWSRPDEIVAEMRAAGFDLAGSFEFLPLQSFQVFHLQ